MIIVRGIFCICSDNATHKHIINHRRTKNNTVFLFPPNTKTTPPRLRANLFIFPAGKVSSYIFFSLFEHEHS